jgi:hypothetical protein
MDKQTKRVRYNEGVEAFIKDFEKAFKLEKGTATFQVNNEQLEKMKNVKTFGRHSTLHPSLSDEFVAGDDLNNKIKALRAYAETYQLYESQKNLLRNVKLQINNI